MLLLHFALIKHHVARATPSQVAWLPPTRRMRHAAVRSRHVVAPTTRWHFAAAAADGSELIGLPRTNCATKKEQEMQREENGENAAGCCPPAAVVTCCLLSPDCVCLLSICGQCDRMPGQHTAHTHGTHAHPHTCVQLSSENGSVKCFPFPGNQSDAIQLRPQPGHAAVLCVPSRCLPNGRIPSKPAPSCAQLTKKKGRGCSAQSGGGSTGKNGKKELRLLCLFFCEVS